MLADYGYSTHHLHNTGMVPENNKKDYRIIREKKLFLEHNF
jgi:hypothetical protein